jgi:hemerythrin-like domain-containing protein
MAEPVAAWHAEHLNFAKLLEFLESEVAEFHEDGHPQYAMMVDILYYLRTYCDRVHHPREDLAFQRLQSRDPSLKPLVDALRQEHRVIARAGDVLMRRLSEVADDVMIPRAELEAAAATYLVYYRHHLRREETEILPRAAQLLDAADWRAIEADMPQTPDPLLGEDVEGRFREMRRQIAMEVRIARQD